MKIVIVATLLCLSGKYGDLLDYISFVVMLFYVITIAGVFILRKKRPDADRPYKAFGYPIVPVLYIIGASVILAVLFIYQTATTWPGLVIVLSGVPVYFWWRRSAETASTDAAA